MKLLVTEPNKKDMNEGTRAKNKENVTLRTHSTDKIRIVTQQDSTVV